jgi:glycosyltransferase involved in cell wall biosynthesis
VLFLGRLTPEKRPDWAIKAFQQIHDGVTRLVIAGGSSATDRYVDDLKQLAARSGDRILFTGAVFGELKEELMAHTRLFVLPSALEGLPITLLEAMSHGRPCLASDIPPHRGIIREGQNGFLHRADDIEHLRDRLSELIHTEAHSLVGVRQAARASVVEEYDWDNVVERTERLYGKLLGAGDAIPSRGADQSAGERPLDKP